MSKSDIGFFVYLLVISVIWLIAAYTAKKERVGKAEDEQKTTPDDSAK